MKSTQKPKIESICLTFLILVGVTDIDTLLRFINSYDFRLGGGLTKQELTTLLKRSPLPIHWCKTPQKKTLYYCKEDKDKAKEIIKTLLKERYRNKVINEKELDLEVEHYVRM